MHSPNDGEYYRTFDGPSLVPSQDVSNLSPEERAATEGWKAELVRLEGEISTLRSVLDAKVRQSTELKRRLGLTTMGELKRDFHHGVQTIRTSESFQKTNEKLHQIGETISSSGAYQKTNSALKTFGSFASRKLGDIRNSNVFKSVEGRVGDAVTSVKHSRSFGNFRTNTSAVSSSQSMGELGNMPPQHIDSMLEDDEVYTSPDVQHRTGAM